MTDAIHTEERHGLTINIYPDYDAENPREFSEPFGKTLYTSRHYTLGDEQVSHEEIEAVTKDKDNVYLPVYAYIHSGIALDTKPFGCSWDSGQCGIIYCTKYDIKREFGAFNDATKKRAIARLESEIKVLDHWLQDNVYGYEIEDDEEEVIHSGWGFYGYYDAEYGALSEARSEIDSLTNKGKTDPNGQLLFQF